MVDFQRKICDFRQRLEELSKIRSRSWIFKGKSLIGDSVSTSCPKFDPKRGFSIVMFPLSFSQSCRFFNFLVTPGRVLCVDPLFALRFSLPLVSLPGAARPERRQSRYILICLFAPKNSLLVNLN